eukprot:274357-Chlamydomonas_euryale.AAC.4
MPLQTPRFAPRPQRVRAGMPHPWWCGGTSASASRQPTMAPASCPHMRAMLVATPPPAPRSSSATLCTGLRMAPQK